MVISILKMYDNHGRHNFESLLPYELKYQKSIKNGERSLSKKQKSPRVVSTTKPDQKNRVNLRIQFSASLSNERRNKPIKSEYIIATYLALHCPNGTDVSNLYANDFLLKEPRLKIQETV